MIEHSGLSDGLRVALSMSRDLFDDRAGLVGFGVAELFAPDGTLLMEQPFTNLITDAGDLYCAQAIIRAVGPANPGAPSPTLPNGMKLGTGTTAVAKSGAGGALVTYKTASNVAFDVSYAQTANLGAGLGVTSIFKTTWGAGIATDAALAEVVIVNDQATNATSSAANTYARSVFGSTINKGASDTLAVTWAWKSLGA
jgi:hypothetical protein